MKRLLVTLATGFICVAASLSPATAQQDERSLVVTEDTDYFGGDYDVRKDVSLEACQQVCIEDAQCQAFTFNVSAGWCFLKESVGELRAVTGAVSGQIIKSGAAGHDLQAVRRAELDFVPRARLDQADQLGGELARRGPVNGDASGLVASGNVALRANDPRRAAELFRDALAI
ncbi:MAG: PAN/Apple domain-containing protein, partial [Alphaproteobacteria bacterium]